jgi:hypothetical protein
MLEAVVEDLIHLLGFRAQGVLEVEVLGVGDQP